MRAHTISADVQSRISKLHSKTCMSIFLCVRVRHRRLDAAGATSEFESVLKNVESCRSLCKYMRTECLEHHYVYESRMPVQRLVVLVADKCQVHARMQSASLLLAGTHFSFYLFLFMMRMIVLIMYVRTYVRIGLHTESIVSPVRRRHAHRGARRDW